MIRPCKSFSGAPFASFEAYSEILGGILEAVGVSGFLSNLHLTVGEANEETLAWQAFIQEWASQKGVGDDAKEMKQSDLAAMYVAMGDAPNLGFVHNDSEAVVGPKLIKAITDQRDKPYKITVGDADHEVKIHRERDKKSKSWNYTIIYSGE